jgi:Vesicle transport v-SNARE protein N-terminus
VLDLLLYYSNQKSLHSIMQEAINEAFEAYAEEFASLMEQIRTATVESTTNQLLQECQDLLQQMAVEARGMDDVGAKRHYMDRHKVYKSQWQSAKMQMEQELLMSRQQGQLQHPRLQTAEDTLARQNAVLAQAARSIQETEEVAVGITANLAENRETLERTSNNAKEVRSMSATANQIATNLLKPWWRKGI